MAQTTCVDCSKTCPTAATIKLTSLGWRVIVKPEDARNVSHWRCAACWQVFKDASGMPSLPPPPRPTRVARSRSRRAGH